MHFFKRSFMLFTVHPRHSQNRAFSALRCFAALFAHTLALPSCIHRDRFSCKHEICLHECTSELLPYIRSIEFIVIAWRSASISSALSMI